MEVKTNERERLENLLSYEVLDTLSERQFDDITSIASQICNTPISLISLIDNNRQWFKSKKGLDINETPREYTFCDHAIKNPNEILIVKDATLDSRFQNNPMTKGETHIVFYAGVPLVSPDGFALGTLCVIDGVTRDLSDSQIDALHALSRQVMSQLELKKISAEIKQKNQTLIIHERLFDLSENLMCIFDLRNKNVKSINNSFAKILGWTIDEIINKTLNDFGHPEDKQHGLKIISRLKNNKKIDRFEMRVLKKDGKYSWVRWSVKPHIETGEVFMLGEDINESKKNEIDKAQAEEKLRYVFDQSVYGVGLINLEQNKNSFADLNEGLAKILGYSIEELKNKPIYTFTHPEDINVTKKTIDSNTFEESVNKKIKKRYIRKDGREIWCETHINKSENSNDLIITFSDITRSYYAKNRQAFLKNELMESQKIISPQNDELKQFAYITSHDLQEPLRTIKSLVEIIQEEFNTKINAENAEYFEYLTKAVDRMSQLISGLLDYSKLDHKLTIEEFEMVDLVENVKADLNTAILEKNAEFHYSNLPKINANKLHIRQLIQNLFANALKFQKEDNVPLIEIKYHELETHHQFIVQDNGIGIPTKLSQKVFGIFQRLHGRNEYNGVGIGLAHCKKIVDIHNGEIWCESDGKNGTEFIFTLKK
jgi:PAS domain S-box-containing protein